MPKQRIRLVEESDTIYEIDENCVKRRKRAQKLTEREKKGADSTGKPKSHRKSSMHRY